MGVVERKRKEMDIQVEILRLEKELNNKRSVLARLREEVYKK